MSLMMKISYKFIWPMACRETHILYAKSSLLLLQNISLHYHQSTATIACYHKIKIKLFPFKASNNGNVSLLENHRRREGEEREKK
mmetsp:Transcript_26213/g.42336  ORF Transcript_26213/g.42336 Transcript_26213/m.42336 type:complete len:85 (+) Transcript_26213:696-950(+)